VGRFGIRVYRDMDLKPMNPDREGWRVLEHFWKAGAGGED
jgi:hypothetical protein